MNKYTLTKLLSTLTLTGMLFAISAAPAAASPTEITYLDGSGQYVQVNYLYALTNPTAKSALQTALARNELNNLPIYVTDNSGCVIDYMAALNKSETYSIALTDPTLNHATAPAATDLYPGSSSSGSDSIALESVSAVNGTITAILSTTPTVAPVISDFTVTTGGLTVTPTAISTSGSVVTLTVPTSSTSSQPAVYSVSYQGGTPLVANTQITNLNSNSLVVGQTFNAVLYTTQEAIDQGYVWNFTINNDAIDFLQLGYSSLTAGSPIEETFTFQANQAGSYKLHFSLEQPWAGSSSSVQTSDFVVNVS